MELKTTVLALQDLQLNINGCVLNVIREKYKQAKVTLWFIQHPILFILWWNKVMILLTCNLFCNSSNQWHPYVPPNLFSHYSNCVCFCWLMITIYPILIAFCIWLHERCAATWEVCICSTLSIYQYFSHSKPFFTKSQRCCYQITWETVKASMISSL